MNLSYQISMVLIHGNISITSIHDVSCNKLSHIFLKNKGEWWKETRNLKHNWPKFWPGLWVKLSQLFRPFPSVRKAPSNCKDQKHTKVIHRTWNTPKCSRGCVRKNLIRRRSSSKKETSGEWRWIEFSIHFDNVIPGYQ